MLKILSASLWLKALKMVFLSHLFWMISSCTIFSELLTGLGVEGLPEDDPGIHLCSQMFELLPLPIFLIKPFSTKLLAPSRLCQIQEAFFWGLHLSMESLGKYLALRTLLISRFGLVNTLQICFPSKALLKASISLNPNPPSRSF